MRKTRREEDHISWPYLTLLLKFQLESEAAVLSSLIALFDIDLRLVLGCLLSNSKEFMPWMNTIIIRLSSPAW
jgi:hypothetical protein